MRLREEFDFGLGAGENEGGEGGSHAAHKVAEEEGGAGEFHQS